MTQPGQYQPGHFPPPRQSGQPYPQTPPKYLELKPLPPGWQQPIQPGQWVPVGNNGIVQQAKYVKEDTEPGRWYLYFIPGITCLALILCVFLPWISIGFFGSSITANGVGGTNMPSSFLESMAALAPTTPTSTPPTSQPNSFIAHDGFIVIVVAVIGAILSLGGLLQRHKGYTIGLVIIGIITVGVFGVEFWNISKTIGDAKAEIAAASTQNIFGVDLSIGFGIYLGIITSITLVVSSIVTYIMFEDNRLQ